MKRGERMEALRKFRESLGLSPEDFAKYIEVSLSLYQKVETGNRRPSREFTEKLKRKCPEFDVNNFYDFTVHVT